MPRRGRCHCGAILEFRLGPDGYKMRCAACGAVVRLRAAAAKKARAGHPVPPAADPAVLPPAPSPFDFGAGLPVVPAPGATPPPPGPFPGLLPGEVPLIDLEPLPTPPRPAKWWGWPLWTGLAAGLVIAGVLAWWCFLRP
jgi:hypothetical protein